MTLLNVETVDDMSTAHNRVAASSAKHGRFATFGSPRLKICDLVSVCAVVDNRPDYRYQSHTMALEGDWIAPVGRRRRSR